jgi:mono/diheme cytochrome c family protein
MTMRLLLPPLAIAAMAALPPLAHAATPAELLTGYATQAASTPSAARGERLFNTRHGQEWSCGSCHGERPAGTGRHAATGKAIAPLAPAFNAERFTDPARVEKWFRRNCNDVMRRECTPAEKADVFAWLIGITR